MKTIIIALLLAFVCSEAVVPVEEQKELEWNPQGLLKCLQEAAPAAPEVIKLIKLLKAKRWAEAFKVAVALVPKGIQIIKKCKSYILAGAAVNLTIDWMAIGKCLLYACSGASLAIGLAITTGNIPMIVILVPQVIANVGGVPKTAKDSGKNYIEIV